MAHFTHPFTTNPQGIHLGMFLKTPGCWRTGHLPVPFRDLLLLGRILAGQFQHPWPMPWDQRGTNLPIHELNFVDFCMVNGWGNIPIVPWMRRGAVIKEPHKVTLLHWVVVVWIHEWNICEGQMGSFHPGGENRKCLKPPSRLYWFVNDRILILAHEIFPFF